MKRVVTVLIGLLIILPGTVLAYNYFFKVVELTAIYETGLHPLDLAIADISSDGIPDIITANRDGRSLSIFLGNGDGNLTPIESISLEKGATSLALVDFDGDSLLDLVVTACGEHCNYNELAFYRGLGGGQFEFVRAQPSEGVPYNIAVGNFNRDAYPDLAASDYPNNRILVFMGQADWQFEPLTLKTSLHPIALAIADLNLDGISDLVTSDHGADGSTIYLGSSDGSFSGPNFLETGDLPYAIKLTDLNQGGYLDLVVAHSSEPGVVSTYFNTGQGTFEFAERFSVNGRLIFVTAADFDFDGRQDLLVTRNKEKYASIFLAGQNGFEDRRESRLDAENEIYSTAIADLNGDSFLDLVTVDYAASTLSVSLGHELMVDSTD